MKRGHLLCQVSHQKVKQPASQELGELKIATCQVKHRTTTTRHVHPETGYAGTGWFEGWFESSWLLGHARCPYVERGVLFQDTNRNPMLAYLSYACKLGSVVNKFPSLRIVVFIVGIVEGKGIIEIIGFDLLRNKRCMQEIRFLRIE